MLQKRQIDHYYADLNVVSWPNKKRIRRQRLRCISTVI